ncbi:MULTISPECIES: glucans biosynthesis glucosyltransferase MdoH [unclassified Paracoccus (in: a-proteobacteria)]|uniref:glucans biosynthesis glucosyltransferase MdoH n=1 Tax=unclassified Paracoccus (in: a-proteobacteria) TaxID=2688777 RepID=UPI0012B2FB6D|nr:MULTISPECIES: glucans biosynthesis glucosyltransferase MdoH [unclassified Paracoccus (in: a-proteobacteria)]UXU74489.1 glucans biosynthesis glucosyltransferase MdoH [Paracoccus sp. SMMA_5]UXU80382.1 glucans biosynthesis glucosyltransferase MdoH [Paracoccus sp. SMMA_5_TC]
MTQNLQADSVQDAPADLPLAADDLWQASADALAQAQATPPEAPLAMPEQDFRAPPPPGPRRGWPAASTIAARIVAFGGAGLIAWVGWTQMVQAFGTQMTWLQSVLLVLFALTFTWVGFSFTSMLAGVFARRLRTPGTPDAARIAVVMPVYNENAAATSGLLAALARDLYRVGLGERAEIFILSDSRDPQAVLEEMAALSRLRDLSPVPVWYRRRTSNKGRKAGNVGEFVRRWGGRYDHMVVLDADSIMGADTIKALSARMNADPAIGLIQTMPMLVGGQTIFSRLTQFAGRIYGPAIARGVAAWSGDSGNFWGHNAIIRVSAFAQCCGLPELPGKPPFGGPILSHDFVEAALLRRAGWKVRLDHDLRQSFEGSPPTLLDMAVRERRWAQGNLQHSRLLFARGFAWISRVHFIIGILGFLMSPIWLAMILVGLALSANVLLSRPDYFPQTYQLFPVWPTFDPVRMLWLFVAAMGFLLVPKFIAIFRAWLRPLARNSGGNVRILASALFEILLSALIAPVQMLIQTRQIIEILRGRDSGWEAQVRAGQMPPWHVVLRRHALHVALGIATLVVLAYLSPWQLVWLSPILAGLILSPLTSRWSASPVFGRWARRQGLLVTPEERETPEILSAANALDFRIRGMLPREDGLQALGEDAALRARIATLLPDSAQIPPKLRLHAIAAQAKIAHAATQAEALSFLEPAERLALIEDRALMDSFARLPQ